MGKTDGLLGHKICKASSLNDTKHQVVVEATSLPKSPTAESRVAGAFENKMSDSAVVEDEESAALLPSRHVGPPLSTILV